MFVVSLEVVSKQLLILTSVMEQHDPSCGVVFVSPDEWKSSILSLLALFLVSTNSWGKYLFLVNQNSKVSAESMIFFLSVK